MSRWVDVDALIDAHYEYCAMNNHREDAVFETWSKELMEKAPSIELPEWISCEKERPKDLSKVLVWSDEGDVGVALFYKFDDDEFDFIKVCPVEGKIIAWMRFPEPYIPEGKSDEQVD